MDLSSILGLILALPNIILITLSQLAFWQRKEYRIDRVLSTIDDSNLSLTRLYAIIPITFLLLGHFSKFQIFGILSLLSILFYYLPKTMTLGIFRPKWTQKSILLSLLLVTSICLYLPFLIITPTNLAVRLSALVIIIFPLTAVLSLITNKLTDPKKLVVIKRAKALRKSLNNLQVIGITGSYGKTTTKHFLSTLLPDAKVSEEHRNSDYVIALDMIEQLTPDTKQYIVEMSAYKKGEIEDIAKLSSPNVGIVTHIGNQHMALFGSQENITNAKWELIKSLPKDGTAILNADDNLITQKAKGYQGSIKWFSLRKQADVYADNIITNPTNLQFTLHVSSNSYDLAVNLLSEAYLSSIIAAACAAHAAGVSDTDIIDRIKNLKALPRTMELFSGANNVSIIDDSYSASEQSVINAIKHIKRFPQADKRIVLVPLIELGSQSKAVHERIGLLLEESECKIYIYGKAFRKQLNQKVFTNPDKLLKALSSKLSSDSVILLEGRVPDVIRKNLTAN